MSKIRFALALIAFLSAQHVFAENNMAPNSSRPCAIIAKACTDAGFVRKGTPGKQFWQNCMKLAILGKTVSGVSVDPSVAKACRTNKIKELKAELQEMESGG